MLRTGLREDIPEGSGRTSGSWLLGKEEEHFSGRCSLDKGTQEGARGPCENRWQDMALAEGGNLRRREDRGGRQSALSQAGTGPIALWAAFNTLL